MSIKFSKCSKNILATIKEKNYHGSHDIVFIPFIDFDFKPKIGKGVTNVWIINNSSLSTKNLSVFFIKVEESNLR